MRVSQHRCCGLSMLLVALPCLLPAQQKGLPPLIPVEQLFENPEITSAQISPDGTTLAYLKAYRGKLNIFVRPIGDSLGERRITADSIRPIRQYVWSRDGRQILYMQDQGGNENFHIYAVDLAAPAAVARDLTPFDSARAIFFDLPLATPGRALVGSNHRDPSVFDAYWLDLSSGEMTMAAENPGNFDAFLLDKDLRVRVASGQNAQGGTVVYARTTEQEPWREVASYPASEAVYPLKVHPDGRRVYLSSDAGTTNFARLVLLDLEAGTAEVAEEDPEGQVDLGAAVWSDLTDELLWTSYEGDTARIYPKTAQVAAMLQDVRKLSNGTISFVSSSADEKIWVVSFDNPVDPGVTYLYDMQTRQSRFLYRPRPWLKPDQLAPMHPVSYRSRDGLPIHGYLTTPPGIPARKLPMVLLVHGGPWARDTYGYDPETQLLANRGYAVLQVNYRGSTGYGKAFYNAAVRQFGRRMHDDLIDGVNWSVAEGIADPKRVGIYGGSYGGYATLVGVTFTPGVFAAAVDYVGPSSLITLIRSFPAYWRPFLEGSWYRFVGDPDKPEDFDDLKSRSPIYLVDSIRTPLLVAQGANDPRVTKVEADQLVIALRERGVKVQYLVAGNEGHGFSNADNRMALYRSMETFLGRYLGGRVETGPKPEIDAQVARLTVEVDTLKLAPAAPPATTP